VKTVVLPAQNKPDLGEVPEEILQGLDIRFIQEIWDITGQAFSPPVSHHA
jgi:ATP-dependent Lon protease